MIFFKKNKNTTSKDLFLKNTINCILFNEDLSLRQGVSLTIYWTSNTNWRISEKRIKQQQKNC